MNDYRMMVISTIRKYRRDIKLSSSVWSENHLSPLWSESHFSQSSYSRWSIGELLAYLEKNKEVPPIILIEDFAKKMDDYSCIDSETSWIFSIAKDVTTDILDTILQMS